MPTILQIANADRNLSSMIKGLKAAGLEDTLNGNGPFTILAPVNLAFSHLAPADFEELLKNKNDSKLSEMLSSCILSEKKLMRNFMNGQKLKTINGKEVDVAIRDGEVRVNGARILARDRQGSNGVVHCTDAVNISS